MPSAPLIPESESLGQHLQRSREEQGLSIEYFGLQTRISEKNLRAMENDDFANLPAEAFARGIYGLYAKALGLNPEEIIARFTTDKRHALPQEYTAGSPYSAPGMDSGRVNSMAEGSVISPFSAFFLLLFLLFATAAGLSWYFQINPIAFITAKIALFQQPAGQLAEDSKDHETTATQATSPGGSGHPDEITVDHTATAPPAVQQLAPAQTTALATAPPAAAPNTVLPAAPSAQAPVAPPPSPSKYTLQAVFYEKTTFSLTIDDERKQELTYQAGDRMIWHAASKMVLVLPTGNSTRFTLNDIPLVLPASKERETTLAIPENLLD